MANSFVTNLYPKPTPGIGDRQVTCSGTSGDFSGTGGTTVTGGDNSAAFNSLTKYVVLDVQVADARVTYDGTAPTASKGHILYSGRSYTWSKQAATAALVINDGSSNSVIQISEFTD
jgi:hypothetical protein|tara:strand:+ start:1106 stop:1456 length:351 start_codon:yes stop_codon:yes gene_type:complete